MSAALIDTETTCLDAPEVIELAYRGPLDTFSAQAETRTVRWKPAKPITLGAMSTHHIIEADLAGCDAWPGSWALPAGIEYIVGHAVDFDWKAIGSPKIQRICTLALARRVWPTLDSHKLGALIYHLYPQGMARTMLREAHSAAVDVDLCARVLFAIIDALRPSDWRHLWQMSEQARIPTVFSFGKHKGLPIAEVKKIDRGYINWCLSGKCDIVNEDPYWQKALRA